MSSYEEDQPFTGASLYYKFLKSYSDLTGKPRVGDKDPRLIEFLPLLWHYFPDAQIIHMVRDPRDVLASKKKAAWSKDRSPLLHLLASRVQWTLGRSQGKKLFGDRYREVVYESLITSPRDELNQLCQWLGMSFEESMLELPRPPKVWLGPKRFPGKKRQWGHYSLETLENGGQYSACGKLRSVRETIDR